MSAPEAMNLLAQTFWLSTLLPGYALAGLICPRRLGVLGTMTRCYVLSVALLMPLVSLAYLLHLGITYVAAGYVLVMFVSLLTLFVWRPPRRRLIQAQSWLPVAVILGLLVAVVPLGTVMHFDALVHIAKIRQAVEVGFSVRDPYSPLDVLQTAHMVSVYHALFSIGAWLTDSEPHRFWFYSAWFNRLLVLGAIEALVSALYPGRHASLTVVLGVTVLFLSASSINLPTFVAGYAITPIVLADLLRADEQPTFRRHVALAMSGLALAATHVGNWLTSVLCIGVGVAGWLIISYRGREGLVRAATLSLALSCGLPILILVALQPSHALEVQGNLFPWMVRTVDVPGFGMTKILEPNDFLWFGFAASAIALIGFVRPNFARRNQLMLSILAAAALIMFVPPIPSILMHWLPHWLIRRARFVPEVIALAGAIGAIVWLTLRSVRSPRSRAALAAVAFFAGVALNGEEFRRWKWASVNEQRVLQEIDDLKDVLAAIGAGRPMVAADPELGLILPAVRELAVMSPPLMHANPADVELGGRYSDLLTFLEPTTLADRRREIAKRHRIEWLVVRKSTTKSPSPEWSDYGALAADSHGFRVYDLRPTLTVANAGESTRRSP